MSLPVDVPDLKFVDPEGHEVKLSSFRGQPLLLVFLRHLACIANQAHLGEVKTIEAFLRERGVRVLAVSFTPPEPMAAYLAGNPQAFTIVSDPSRQGYEACELKRTSLLSFFKPRVLGRFIRQILRGGRIRKPLDSDVLQLGGDFLFDASGQLAWSWPSQDATDRPTPADIRAAVEKLQTAAL